MIYIAVLIVAKCIVNSNVRELLKECKGVLIVAKCIVNTPFLYAELEREMY